MAWSVLQSASNPMSFGHTIESTTVTLGSNCTSGTVLIAYVYVSDSSSSTVMASVKDGAGNSMTKLAEAIVNDAGTFCDASIWAMTTPAGDVGITPTFTATTSPANSFAGGMIVQEVSGIQAVLDGTAGTSTGSASPTGTPSYSSASSNEYLVSFRADQNGNGQTITGPSSPWTTDAHSILTNGSAGGGGAAGVAYRNSTGGTESDGWTDSLGSGADFWSLIVVAFQLTGGGAPPPLPAWPQSLSLLRRPLKQVPQVAQIPAAPPPLPAQQQAASLLALRLPQSPQSIAVPGPTPPLPAPQNATSLLQRRLAQQTAAAQTPAPPPPPPPLPQSALLIQLRLPQAPQSIAVPSPPPPPGPQPQSVLLIQRGMAQPGNYNQAPAVQVTVYTAGQPQQALNLVLQGLPQTMQQPNAAVLVPPVPAPQNALNLLLQGLPQQQAYSALPPPPPPPGPQPQSVLLVARGLAQPGNYQPGVAIPPPVLSPGVPLQQSPLLLQRGLATQPQSVALPPVVVVVPPLAGQPQQALTLIVRGLTQPAPAGLVIVVPQQGIVAVTITLAATTAIANTAAGNVAVTTVAAASVAITDVPAATVTISTQQAGAVTIVNDL